MVIWQSSGWEGGGYKAELRFTVVEAPQDIGKNFFFYFLERKNIFLFDGRRNFSIKEKKVLHRFNSLSRRRPVPVMERTSCINISCRFASSSRSFSSENKIFYYFFK